MDDVDISIEAHLEGSVPTPELDHRPSQRAASPFSDESNDSGEGDLWSNDDSAPITSDDESTTSPYEVPETEAYSYYAGVRSNGRGPKLIYRTSDDKFEEPFGPEAYPRLMRIVAVPDSHELGQNGLWDRVRDKVPGFLASPQYFDSRSFSGCGVT